MHCTCAPHPRINLTAAFTHHHDRELKGGSDDEAAVLSTLQRQVRDACQSHGCFHVTIDVEAVGHDESSHSVQCLSKPMKEMEDDIESLFSSNFLGAATKSINLVDLPNSNQGDSNSSSTNYDDYNFETICNGGLLEVPFPTSCLPNAQKLQNATSNNNASITATFRGRVAESGDEQQKTPEPKLSWEFQRCIGTSTNNTLQHNGKERNESWTLLPKWTEALHSVASMIINLLEIPTQLVLQEKPCQCNQNENEGSKQSCHGCCNIDLLRVFRYDALSPQNTNKTMGSSAHSDWGTLTVVWQDDKGGLQTYCHSCGKWSDVDAAIDENDKKGATNGTCSLFVHVGDFLSLSTIPENDDCSGRSLRHGPMWPSPRHQVLCPTSSRQHSSGCKADDANDCRRSLVYFAYPPPGISLNTAREVVAPIAASYCSSSAVNMGNGSGSCEFYDFYSLLHNQSHQQNMSMAEDDSINNSKEDENAAFQTHQLMKGIPFNQVISEKWNQVQRRDAAEEV